MSPTLLDSARVRRLLRRSFLLSVPTSERRVALTFDDGPNPRNTPRLLDLLADRGVPATFFLVGRNARRRPALARRIVEAGHAVGNHTDAHLPLPLLPRHWIEREIRRGKESIAGACGFSPEYCRPPFGWFSRRVLRAMHAFDQIPVIGDVYPKDSTRPGSAEIVGRVMDRVGPGSIVILHDGGWHARVDRSQTVRAVGTLIDRLREADYRFQTLYELEGRRPGQGLGQGLGQG